MLNGLRSRLTFANTTATVGTPPETGHVDTPLELVAEQADPGAEEGAGPEIQVEEPWPGYDRMATPELTERLHEASDEVAAVVDLYERMHRDRRPVREAAARALSRR